MKQRLVIVPRHCHYSMSYFLGDLIQQRWVWFLSHLETLWLLFLHLSDFKQKMSSVLGFWVEIGATWIFWYILFLLNSLTLIASAKFLLSCKLTSSCMNIFWGLVCLPHLGCFKSQNSKHKLCLSTEHRQPAHVLPFRWSRKLVLNILWCLRKLQSIWEVKSIYFLLYIWDSRELQIRYMRTHLFL